MLPSAAQFSSALSALGINRGDHVVIYDTAIGGIFSAARLWWMFHVFDHPNVSVLNGGLAKWKLDIPQLMVASGAFSTETSKYIAPEFNAKLVRGKSSMIDLIAAPPATRGSCVVDARPAGRFDGSAPEPRPGMVSGHMFGARNIPFMSCLDPVTKEFFEEERLRAIFTAAGVNPRYPTVATCGSGVTACVVVRVILVKYFIDVVICY